MPLLHLTLAGALPAADTRTRLQQALTQLVAEQLAKQAPLTVVTVESLPAPAWAAAGVTLAEGAWAASLQVQITAGTNTAAERAAFIARADALLRAHWPRPPAAPLYVVLHEVDATSWGYDGRTQDARRTERAGTAAQSAPPLTLRERAGLPPRPRPPREACALLLIDFQREYGADGALPLDGLEAAAAQALRLADAAARAGLPIFHVHHVASSAGAPLFSPGSVGVQPLPGLTPREGDRLVLKSWPSAFHLTDLAGQLDALGVRRLVLAGCMTHNCVDSTAREALHRGYDTWVVADACATRALPAGDGGTLSAAAVHRHILAGLADRHAVVLDAAAVVAGWEALDGA